MSFIIITIISSSSRFNNNNNHTLTIPPPIPNFKVVLTFDRNPTLRASEDYTNAIKLMTVFALFPYDSLIRKNYSGTSSRYPEITTISPWPVGPYSHLLVKHAVQALYEGGRALARITSRVKGRCRGCMPGCSSRRGRLGG